MCGKFINDRKLRDQIVLATKFTFNGSPGNPNSGGNGRKNIYRAIDASLRGSTRILSISIGCTPGTP
jgi:aryl-alcohol dehydrogenase-like predicted oxidoreductase